MADKTTVGVDKLHIIELCDFLDTLYQGINNVSVHGDFDRDDFADFMDLVYGTVKTWLQRNGLVNEFAERYPRLFDKED